MVVMILATYPVAFLSADFKVYKKGGVYFGCLFPRGKLLQKRWSDLSKFSQEAIG